MGRGADLEEMGPGWEMGLGSQLSQAMEGKTGPRNEATCLSQTPQRPVSGAQVPCSPPGGGDGGHSRWPGACPGAALTSSCALCRGLMKTCSRRGRLLASSPTTRTGSPSRPSIFRYRILLCQQRWHIHFPAHYPVPGPGCRQETTAPAFPQPEAWNRDSCVSDFPEVQSPSSPRRLIPWGCWGPGTCSLPQGRSGVH